MKFEPYDALWRFPRSDRVSQTQPVLVTSPPILFGGRAQVRVFYRALGSWSNNTIIPVEELVGVDE